MRQLIDGFQLAAALIGALSFFPGASDAATPTDLRIKATGASLRTGRTARFAATVANRGDSATDAAIHVLVTLPPDISFVSQRRAGWVCSTAGQTVDCRRDEPLNRGRASTLLLTVAVCNSSESVDIPFRVAYPADTDPSNDVFIKTRRVHPGQCVAGTPTPSRTPGSGGPTHTPGQAASPTAVAPGSPTATSPPANPNAPVVTSFTCNGAPQCTVSVGQSFTLQFSLTDVNGNATSYQMTSRRDDGHTSQISSGNFGTPRASHTVTLNFPPFTCPVTPCRQTRFDFTVVVSDSTSLSSSPVTVPITVRASGQ